MKNRRKSMNDRFQGSVSWGAQRCFQSKAFEERRSSLNGNQSRRLVFSEKTKVGYKLHKWPGMKHNLVWESVYLSKCLPLPPFIRTIVFMAVLYSRWKGSMICALWITCQYNKEPCLKEGIPIIVFIVQLIEASTCVWGVFIMELANSDLPTQMYK